MVGVSLDPYLDLYADRTRGMTASEIRSLFSVASRPEVVSLAGGMPNLAALPMEAVGQLTGELVSRHGQQTLQYSSGQGYPVLREQICEVMSLQGIVASPDDVVVTVGSQQALDLVARVFLNPGDVVLAEAPSYVGALGTFQAAQADVVHVDMDADGLIPEALEAAITAVKASGRRIKLLYTVPNFHNPAGVTLAEHRRDRIVEICRAGGVLVLEDDPYGLLGFDTEPMKAMRARVTDGVIYLGSFSKTFAPGLRVGWVLAPHAVREKLVMASEAQILDPPTLNQHIVSTYLATQPWQEQIKAFREAYRERRDATLEALTTMFPVEATWTVPAGGFYVWVKLPPGLHSKGMLPRAVANKVAYVPGTGFYADGQGSDHIRLSYCYPEPARIREGVRRLAQVINDELELVHTFGTSGQSSVAGDQRHNVATRSPGSGLA